MHGVPPIRSFTVTSKHDRTGQDFSAKVCVHLLVNTGPKENSNFLLYQESWPVAHLTFVCEEQEETKDIPLCNL
jgi:hypothetical protein